MISLFSFYISLVFAQDIALNSNSMIIAGSNAIAEPKIIKMEDAPYNSHDTVLLSAPSQADEAIKNIRLEESLKIIPVPPQNLSNSTVVPASHPSSTVPSIPETVIEPTLLSNPNAPKEGDYQTPTDLQKATYLQNAESVTQQNIIDTTDSYTSSDSLLQETMLAKDVIVINDLEFSEMQRSLKILALRMANSPTFNGMHGSPVLRIERFINATSDPNLDLERLEATLRDYAYEKTSLQITSQSSINTSPFLDAQISILHAGEKNPSKKKNNIFLIRVVLFDQNRKIKGYWSERTRADVK